MIYRVQAAILLAPEGTVIHDILEEALQRADRLVNEGRDRIQDLRIASEVDVELWESLTATGRQLARDRATAFSASLEGKTRVLTTTARDEAFSIGREALLNAVVHAQASAIELQLIFSDDRVRLRVRDDGIGLTETAFAAPPRLGHWGLQGMKERAEKLGAQLTLWSRHGAGTEIELVIPAKIAYPGRRSRTAGLFDWFRSPRGSI